MILFFVRHRTENHANSIVLVTARDREYAKSKASQFLGGDPDKYIVTPLTAPGDRIHLDITVNS